jgi:hypothetical protein
MGKRRGGGSSCRGARHGGGGGGPAAGNARERWRWAAVGGVARELGRSRWGGGVWYRDCFMGRGGIQLLGRLPRAIRNNESFDLFKLT